MIRRSFEELLEDYLKGLLSGEELAGFLQMTNEDAYSQRLKNAIENALNSEAYEGIYDQDKADDIFQKIMEKAGSTGARPAGKIVYMHRNLSTRKYWRWVAAASAVGALLLGWYFWDMQENMPVISETLPEQTIPKDVSPGSDRAVLTLGDGSTVVLDKNGYREVIRQGNARVLQNGSRLAYDNESDTPGEILINTLTTPRGGQYEISLADGSRVWLNAASSLQFPTAFRGKERRVELTGEAYFEVRGNKKMPFVVVVNGAEVQATGTRFNIMAYQEEAALATTLLDGVVSFLSGGRSSLLKPGQQALQKKDGTVRLLNNVAIGEVTAWKDGWFRFEGTDLGTVMRQLSRWYDVDIVIETERVNDPLYAEIPRNTMLSDALKALEISGTARFGIEGKKIIVMP